MNAIKELALPVRSSEERSMEYKDITLSELLVKEEVISQNKKHSYYRV